MDDRDPLYDAALQALLRIHSDASVPVDVTRRKLSGLRDEIGLLIDTLRWGAQPKTFECAGCKRQSPDPGEYVWTIEHLANPEAPEAEWVCIACDMHERYPLDEA